nr:MAG TPA: hypothetical protein [Caudoviricetes sp.]
MTFSILLAPKSGFPNIAGAYWPDATHFRFAWCHYSKLWYGKASFVETIIRRFATP